MNTSAKYAVSRVTSQAKELQTPQRRLQLLPPQNATIIFSVVRDLETKALSNTKLLNQIKSRTRPLPTTTNCC